MVEILPRARMTEQNDESECDEVGPAFQFVIGVEARRGTSKPGCGWSAEATSHVACEIPAVYAIRDDNHGRACPKRPA
jgi:hypothetical protein